jgi:predicted amidohydrolase
LIGQPEAAIAHMDRWLERAAGEGVELTLFPELNVSGYITHPVAAEIGESVPGPAGPG